MQSSLHSLELFLFTRHHGLEPGGADALVGPAGLGLILDDDASDVYGLRMDAGGRGDGVEARLEARKQLHQVVDLGEKISVSARILMR